jgi:hypothetical protein
LFHRLPSARTTIIPSAYLGYILTHVYMSERLWFSFDPNMRLPILLLSPPQCRLFAACYLPWSPRDVSSQAVKHMYTYWHLRRFSNTVFQPMETPLVMVNTNLHNTTITLSLLNYS